MNDITLKIEGMSCQHCVMRVKKAIDSVQGVSKAEVVIGQAVVSFDETKNIKRGDLCGRREGRIQDSRQLTGLSRSRALNEKLPFRLRLPTMKIREKIFFRGRDLYFPVGHNRRNCLS